MLSLKKESDRWLGILEMGFDLNGAGDIEGPIEEILKEVKGKVVAELSGGEGELEMGRNKFGPFTNKEMGSSGLIREKHVEAQVSNVKPVEPVLSLTMYSHQIPPQ